MQCPVCRTHEQPTTIDLQTSGFAEDILTCSICGAVWAINHGATELVRDPQEQSFLSALSESVEGDDYSIAA